MSIERQSRTIPASGVIEIGVGNFMLLISATAAINLRAENGGVSEGFNSITGGILIRRVRPWDNMRILGAVGTTVEYIVGSERVEQDETDVRLQIATISGIVPMNENPAATVADTAAVSCANAALTAVVPQNLLRRRVSLTIDSTATGPVYARTAGGANNLLEMQPGVTYEFKGTYAISVRNDTGAAVNAYIFEEA